MAMLNNQMVFHPVWSKNWVEKKNNTALGAMVCNACSGPILNPGSAGPCWFARNVETVPIGADLAMAC